MGQRKKRRKFSNEFKAKAVDMTNQEGMTISKVAIELGVSEANLCQWKRAIQEEESIDKAERKLDALQENVALKDENKRLRMENEILKKAAAYFASQK